MNFLYYSFGVQSTPEMSPTTYRIWFSRIEYHPAFVFLLFFLLIVNSFTRILRFQRKENVRVVVVITSPSCVLLQHFPNMPREALRSQASGKLRRQNRTIQLFRKEGNEEQKLNLNAPLLAPRFQARFNLRQLLLCNLRSTNDRRPHN